MMRNCIEKTQFYDSRGLPSSITASGIIIMAYTFNNKGNLFSRSDLLAGHKENFTYDTMNRLTAWDVSKSNVSQVNIKFIKQIGRYGKFSSKNRNGV